MPPSPVSSLEISQILACMRKHRTGFSVWTTTSLSLPSLLLNIHCCGWANLWGQLCQDWKVATFQPWKFKAELEVCALCSGQISQGRRDVRGYKNPLLQLCLGQERRRHSFSGLARSSTMVTLALREHLPCHASRTNSSWKVVAVLLAPEGCSAVWTGTRRYCTLASAAGWGCEKALDAHWVPSAQSIQTLSQRQVYVWHRGTSWTCRSQSWEFHRVDCRAPPTPTFVHVCVTSL